MKTQIIDRTTGGSAETFKIGMEGYFWDAVFGPVRKGVYAGGWHQPDKTEMRGLWTYQNRFSCSSPVKSCLGRFFFSPNCFRLSSDQIRLM